MMIISMMLQLLLHLLLLLEMGGKNYIEHRNETLEGGHLGNGLNERLMRAHGPKSDEE